MTKALRDWNFSPTQVQALRVVAFDLDDTLTERGALPAAVVTDLERVAARGWRVVLVTGRPAGWADALIKLLPFDGVVAENGSVLYFWGPGRAARGAREEPRRLFWSAPSTYAERLPRRAGLFEDAERRILARFPRARVASDQPFRLYDLAIDFAEEVDPPLPLSDAEVIAREFAALGATAKVSSIHVNGWWGSFTKREGLTRLLAEWTLAGPETSVVYVGDSPNDVPLFEAAAVSVGVANLARFGQLAKSPDYLADGESAQGSRELLAKLLAAPAIF
jgi:HAD superfamily hydrolase (TIGR01484 family)